MEGRPGSKPENIIQIRIRKPAKQGQERVRNQGRKQDEKGDKKRDEKQDEQRVRKQARKQARKQDYLIRTWSFFRNLT